MRSHLMQAVPLHRSDLTLMRNPSRSSSMLIALSGQSSSHLRHPMHPSNLPVIVTPISRMIFSPFFPTRLIFLTRKITDWRMMPIFMPAYIMLHACMAAPATNRSRGIMVKSEALLLFPGKTNSLPQAMMARFSNGRLMAKIRHFRSSIREVISSRFWLSVLMLHGWLAEAETQILK